jgi:hypothetical protein
MPPIPEKLDDTVRGLSVTYWLRPGLLYLIQHSPTASLPCFRKEDGVRRRIDLSFDASELYWRVLRFAQNNTKPEATNTDCPSIEVGIATDGEQLFAHVKMTEDALEDDNLRALKLMLDEIIGS